MTTETTAPRKRRRKRKSKECEVFDYYAQIDDWEANVSLSPGLARFRGGKYWESFGVTLYCRFIYPEKLLRRPIKVSIHGDREISRDLTNLEADPTSSVTASVGSLNQVRPDGHSYAYLCAPIEHIHPILTLLTSGHFRFVEMRGEKIRYGSALLRSWEMRPKLDPEEVPEGVVELPRAEIDPSPSVDAPPVRSG
jgi:hypothetical protein